MFWLRLFELGAVVLALLNLVPLLVYAERKICARIQGRLGPNRVDLPVVGRLGGLLPRGLGQPVADSIKLFFKEDFTPAGADRFLYFLAPLFVFLPPLLAFSAIPFGRPVLWGGREVALQAAGAAGGILFIFAVTSLGVYGVTFGGWASNNKFSLLGGIRASAQMISYEIGMGLALVAVLMSAGSADPAAIVADQTETLLGFIPRWNVLRQPLAFLLFLVAAFAETNRLPFDLPEAESELVGGYHTEYGGMKFGLFFLGEYLAMTTMSALIVTLFFGGWHFPGMGTQAAGPGAALLSVAVFGGKVLAFLFFYIWVRWSLPRFRYDQLMDIGWKILVPLGLLNIAVTGILTV